MFEAVRHGASRSALLVAALLVLGARAERIGTDPFDGTNLHDPSDITQIRDDLAENPEVWSAIDLLWPRLTPQRLVADFLAAPEESVSGDLLPAEDADAVRRPVTRHWTVADVPLLDEAAELLGEDDRLAMATMRILRRDLVGLDVLEPWVARLAGHARAHGLEDKDPYLVSGNVQRYLRALYLQVALAPNPPANRPDLLLVLIERLKQSNPETLGAAAVPAGSGRA